MNGEENCKSLSGSEPPVLIEIFTRFKEADLESDQTEDYRYLRNFTTCEDHQNVINKFIYQGNLKFIIRRLDFLFNTISMKAGSELTKDNYIQMRCGVQFLGNVVANHYNNKLIVFMEIFPVIKNWLAASDAISRKYTLMVLYNCVLNVPHHVEYLINENELSAIISVLKLSFEDNCEWGFYLLEYLLTFPNTIQIFCSEDVPDHLWIALLQLIHSKIINGNSIIDLSGIFFLEKRFIKETDFVLAPNPPDYKSEKLLEIVEILDVLCAATSAQQYEAKLKQTTCDRQPSVLLCHTIAVLKAVHIVTQMQTPSGSHTVEKLCNVPTYNFQKGLITLIANLCFKNRVLQIKLREVDGIPLLLDCCKLNAKIPFITQWVIFAIRSACDNNLENQELIAQMNKLGLVDISLDEVI